MHLVIAPFNGAYLLTALFFIALIVVSSWLLRKKSERTRARVLAAAMAVTFVVYWAYKGAISVDADYAAILAAAGIGSGTFTWWEELPFQLCNVNLMLIPVAALTRKRPLCAFCFFMAPLGGLMALIMPSTGFSGYELFLPRVLGYYVTHWMVVAGGAALASFGLYRPRFRDIPYAVLTTFAVAFFSFAVSFTLRRTQLSAHANYFFTMEPESNPLLGLFHKLIPVPYLYLLPSTLIMVPYMLLVTGGFALFDKLHGEPAGDETDAADAPETDAAVAPETSGIC